MDRPAFLKAISYCQRNREKISYFVVYRLDRFSRSQVDHYTIKTSLRKIGIRLVSATQEVDETQPESILIEGIAAAVGEYESRIIGLRAKTGMEEARRNGRISNLAPIGYLNARLKGIGNSVIPDEVLAPYIREAFSRYADGVQTKAEIVDELNRAGYLSPRGHRLSKQQLGKILVNRTYAGSVFVNDKEGWVKGTFEPLVTLDLFERVQDRLRREKAPQSKPHLRIREEFPLRGFVFCRKCNQPLTGSLSRGKSGKRYGYYRCFNQSCYGVNIRKEIIEKEFVALLARLIPTRQFAKAFISAAKKAYTLRKERQSWCLNKEKQKHEQLQAKLQKLVDMYLDGQIDMDMYKYKHTSINTEIQETGCNLRHLTEEQIDLFSIIERAVYCLDNAANMWVHGDLNTRRVFQKALFPMGLTYCHKGKFGTPLSSKHFNYLEVLQMNQELMAGGQGFEPR